MPVPRDEKSWWALKIVTLLHDVPWKPWLIAGGYGGERPAKKCLSSEAERLLNSITNSIRNLEANDEEAIASILYLFDGLKQDIKNFVYEAIKNYWSVVREADVRASSADRLLTPRIRPFEPRKFVNIFRPELTIDIGTAKPSEGTIAGYLKEVRKIVERASQGAVSIEDALKRIYFTLFALMETSWYMIAGSKAVPPADTRLPHHTVFHHLYASTAMLNTIGCWALVEIDTPGIQGFVRQGRKTGDFWAGSWLISFLTWKAVEAFVNVFGPDIVLSPAIFLNPFYLDMVLGLGAVDETSLPYIAWRSKWPEQPVVPGTVTLIIPIPCKENEDSYISEAWSKLLNISRTERAACSLEKVKQGSEEDLEKCISAVAEYSVKSVWRSIVEKVINDEKIGYLIDQICNEVEEEKRKDCKNLLLEYLRSIVDKPPIIHRIVAVRIVDDDIRSYIMRGIEKSADEGIKKFLNFLEEFIEKDIHLERSRLIDVIVNIYRIPYAEKKLGERLDNKPMISIDTGSIISRPIQEFTAKIYKDALLPRYKVCSLCGKIPAVVYMRRGEDPSKVDYLLDEGEALCPYCLVRRVLCKRTDKLLDGVLHSRPSKRAVLSTLDVANLWNLELAEELRQGSYEESYVGYEYKIKPYKILAEKAGGDISRALVSMDIVLSQRGLDIISEVNKSLAQKLKNYIAYVIGDGDNLGRGCWKGVLPRPSGYDEYRKYLAKLVGDAIDGGSAAWKMMEPNIIYLYRVLRNSEILGNIDEESVRRWLGAYGIVAYIGKRIGLVDPLASVLATPSYVYTLSHSLLVSSLIDSLIVEALGGVLVYAGGDDIATIVPVHGSIANIGNRFVVLPLYTLSIVLSNVLPRELMMDVTGVYRAIESVLFGGFADVVKTGKVGSIPVPLLLVIMTRLNYWGMIPTVIANNIRGFHIYNGIFTPAVVAYGKSYGVLIAHQRDPMWIAYSVAAELEELKSIIRVDGVDRVAVEKDLLISMYGRIRGYIADEMVSEKGSARPLAEVEISFIPLSLARIDDATALVRSLLEIYACLETGSLCRKSLVYSMIEPSTEELLTRLAKNDAELGRRFLEYLIRRHVSEGVAGRVCAALLNPSGIKTYELFIARGNTTLFPTVISMIALLRFLYSAG